MRDIRRAEHRSVIGELASEDLNLGRHSLTGEFPEVLVVMQTELGSFDFAAFFASEEMLRSG